MLFVSAARIPVAFALASHMNSPCKVCLDGALHSNRKADEYSKKTIVRWMGEDRPLAPDIKLEAMMAGGPIGEIPTHEGRNDFVF
jgi:hypothetical protein